MPSKKEKWIDSLQLPKDVCMGALRVTLTGNSEAWIENYRGMVPSGAVKFVLDALIDTLNLNLRKGISVQLGDFGCFRPGMNCESQDTEKEVDSDTIRRVKIIFTPGYKFKEMLSKVSVQKAVASDDGSISPEQPDPNPNPNPDDGKGEAPDPAA